MLTIQSVVCNCFNETKRSFCVNMWQWLKHGSTTSLQSQMGSQLSESCPKRPKMQTSAGKVLASVFWGAQGFRRILVFFFLLFIHLPFLICPFCFQIFTAKLFYLFGIGLLLCLYAFSNLLFGVTCFVYVAWTYLGIFGSSFFRLYL